MITPHFLMVPYYGYSGAGRLFYIPQHLFEPNPFAFRRAYDYFAATCRPSRTVIAHEVGLPFRPARRSAGLAG